jgi:cell division protein FtsI/penicillin-binding protein 2
LITAYSALINGGQLLTPQLAAERGFKPRERARLEIEPAHRALLIEGMRGAVAYGTAERAHLYRLPFYVFGKTGTATSADRLHTQGWFVGFAADDGQAQGVAPESARLVVLVFLKNTHGEECAESARPVFEAFAAARSKARPDASARTDATPLSAASTSRTTGRACDRRGDGD